MKYKLFIINVLIFSFCYSQKIDVMSFNIRYSNENDKENSWTNRQSEVIKMLSYYQPEVIGIQEALSSQILDLTAGLQKYKSVGVARDDGKEEGEYSAIFYNFKKLEVLKSGTFWLSQTPEIPSMGWDAVCNRICTYALLRDKKSGKEFWAFNTHLDHIGKVAREKSAALILMKIKSINTQNLPIVLTGDFNGTEESTPIQQISKELNDSFYNSEQPHYGPIGTFQDFEVNKVSKNRIDYIFTKGLNVKKYRTIDDKRANLLQLSDHYPILVVLEMN